MYTCYMAVVVKGNQININDLYTRRNQSAAYQENYILLTQLTGLAMWTLLVVLLASSLSVGTVSGQEQIESLSRLRTTRNGDYK